MNFEQWKLRRELEEQTEFISYSSKIKSITSFCLVFCGASVFVLMVAIVTFMALKR